MQDDDAAGRSTRIRIIVGVTAAALLASLAIGVIGNRLVDDEVSRIRAKAATAVIDPNDVATSGFEGSSDPVADAFGTEPRELVQNSDLGWCAWIDISHLASKRSLYFVIGANGTVVEAKSC